AKLLGKHNIKVYSDIPEGSYFSLSVHCGSKDNDFGNRVLYRGQSFDWNFRTNFVGNTLYFCTLVWGPRKKSFDVFKGSWSKDNDFGNRVLYRGQSFDWNFRTNFVGNTLYFCTLVWGPRKKSFDVFKGSWDRNDYHHDYIYVADLNGVYLSHDPNNLSQNLQFLFQWD
ncbi:hypothetical protein PHJA_001429300, partial [Phtheirospermum japonicum]